MSDNSSRFMCTLWICSAIFTAIRYLGAAILAAGSYGDAGIYNQCLERMGPFFPMMSILCLLGGLAFSVVELINVVRARKK